MCTLQLPQNSLYTVSAKFILFLNDGEILFALDRRVQQSDWLTEWCLCPLRKKERLIQARQHCALWAPDQCTRRVCSTKVPLLFGVIEGATTSFTYRYYYFCNFLSSTHRSLTTRAPWAGEVKEPIASKDNLPIFPPESASSLAEYTPVLLLLLGHWQKTIKYNRIAKRWCINVFMQ